MGHSYMPSSDVAPSETEAALSTESQAVSTVEEEPLSPVFGPRVAEAVLRLTAHETAQSPEVNDAPSPEVGDSQSEAETQDLLAGAAFAAIGSRRHRLSPDRLAEIQEQRDELPADSGVDHGSDGVHHFHPRNITPGTVPQSTETFFDVFDEINLQGDALFEAVQGSPKALLADALLAHALKEEYEVSNTLGGTVRASVWHTGKHILFSMEPRVLKGLLEGNLAHQYKNNTEVRDRLDELWGNRFTQPSIYAQMLADADGRSPTIAELRQVIKQLRDYSDVENGNVTVAHAIDRRRHPSWEMADTEDGVRRYFTYNAGAHEAVNRPDELEEFCQNLEERLQEHADQDQPFPRLLTEVGYSKQSDRRLKFHREHKSSNWLMNLTQAVLEVLFPDRFYLWQFVVFYIFTPKMAALAEILITHFAHGYTSTGEGFSTYAAGRSVTSVRDFTPAEWDEFLKDTLENTPIQRNYAAQLDLREALIQLGRREIEKIEEKKRTVAMLKQIWDVRARTKDMEAKIEAAVAKNEAAAVAKTALARDQLLSALGKLFIQDSVIDLLYEEALEIEEAWRAIEEGRRAEYKENQRQRSAIEMAGLQMEGSAESQPEVEAREASEAKQVAAEQAEGQQTEVEQLEGQEGLQPEVGVPEASEARQVGVKGRSGSKPVVEVVIPRRRDT